MGPGSEIMVTSDVMIETNGSIWLRLINIDQDAGNFEMTKTMVRLVFLVS